MVKVLTTKEAAKVMKFDEMTIRRKIAKGEIFAIKFGGEWRIPCDKRNPLLMYYGG